jgi:hypothetical protein
MNRALIAVNSAPADQGWLEQIVEQTMARSAVQGPLVFLNVSSEWVGGIAWSPIAGTAMLV